MKKLAAAKKKEVAFGEGVEVDIWRQWKRVSPYATGVRRWMRARVIGDFLHFDFIGFSAEGIPLTYLEVKERRVAWGAYPDLMMPFVKHAFAKRLARSTVPLISVTRYSCGSLVELDLADEPDEIRFITRSDRPNESVKHCFWSADKVKVYE